MTPSTVRSTMAKIKKLIEDFKTDFNTAPAAVKPLGIEKPAKVTRVVDREEAGRALAAGLKRIRSAR